RDVMASDREPRRTGHRSRRDRRVAECGRPPVADIQLDRRSEMRDLTLVAAVVAAGLFFALRAFQVALAAGAPLGDHVLGGRFPGTLPRRPRLFSGLAAVLLIGLAV